MRFLKLMIVLLVLAAWLSACRMHRHNYSSGRYRREHVPAAPPGYRGL